jgi:hypothetical protein
LDDYEVRQAAAYGRQLNSTDKEYAKRQNNYCKTNSLEHPDFLLNILLEKYILHRYVTGNKNLLN